MSEILVSTRDISRGHLTFADYLAKELYIQFHPETVILDASAVNREITRMELDEGVLISEMDIAGTLARPMYDHMFVEWRDSTPAIEVGDQIIGGAFWQGAWIERTDDDIYEIQPFTLDYNNRVHVSDFRPEIQLDESGAYVGFSDGKATGASRIADNIANLARKTLEDLGKNVSDSEIREMAEQRAPHIMPTHVVSGYPPFLAYVFGVIHSKAEEGMDVDLITHPRGTRRALKRRTGKTPSPYFKVCDIHPNRRSSASGGSVVNGSAKAKRVHTVRGHFRRLGDGRVTWVRAHMRGSKDAGITSKSYRIVLED